MQASEGSFLCIQASLLLTLVTLLFILPICFLSPALPLTSSGFSANLHLSLPFPLLFHLGHILCFFPGVSPPLCLASNTSLFAGWSLRPRMVSESPNAGHPWGPFCAQRRDCTRQGLVCKKTATPAPTSPVRSCCPRWGKGGLPTSQGKSFCCPAKGSSR